MATTKIIPDLTALNKADTTKSLKMPSGGGFSGTATEGMLRNDTSQSSQSSASTMQFYNGTDWKNFVNSPLCTTTTCSFPTGPTAVALFQMESSSVTDTCGNFSLAALNNMTFTSGKFGNAATFNGTDSRIDITGQMPSDTTSDYAISAWVKADALGSAGRVIFSNIGAGGSTGTGQAAVYIWNSKLRLYIYNGANFHVYDGPSTLTTATWYNIVANIDINAGTSTSLTAYINGSAETLSFIASTTITGNSSSQFGTAQSLHFWDGQIDQVRVYTSTISLSQAGELNTEIGC
mgnify:CR=1 FL=1